MITLSREMDEKFVNSTFIIGVGGQRCGTSWLHKYLNSHPQYCSQPEKELHYFDSMHAHKLFPQFNKTFRRKFNDSKLLNPYLYFRLCMIRDDSVYMNYFRWLYSGERAFGDITPSYCMLDRRIYGLMQSMHPCVKFIFILRNPVDRIWSQIHLRLRVKGIVNTRKKKETKKIVHRVLSNDPQFVLRTDYQRTLQELLSVVERKNVLVLFYEELFSDKSMKKICDFARMDFVEGEYENRVFPIRKDEMDAELRHRIACRFQNVYEYVQEFFSGKIPQSWQDDMHFSGRNYPAVSRYRAKVPRVTLRRPFWSSRFNLKADNPLPKLAFGKIHLRKGEDSHARRCFEEALILDDTLFEPYYQLGWIHARNGQNEQALSMFQKAVSLKPDIPDLYMGLGMMLKNMGDFAGAETALQQATRLEPDNPVARRALQQMVKAGKSWV